MLRVHSVSGGFANIHTLSRISFALHGNRVRTLVNRGNTNGSALVGILANIRRFRDNSVRVTKGDGMVMGRSPRRTRTGNVDAICRRMGLYPGLAMTRGLFVKERPQGFKVVS